jgi:hypothetical protein
VRDDDLFRRLGRTALVLCAVMTLAAFALAGVAGAAAVAGGGVLSAVSYFALGTGTSLMVDAMSGRAGANRARVVRSATVRLVGRYALLGFLAYVMIARLRLHPLGLLAGASSVAAAAFVEAVRLLTKKSS